MSVPTNGQFTFCMYEYVYLMHFVVSVDQGSKQPQNDEHPPLALDNKGFDVSSIVENTVSQVSFKFLKASKLSLSCA